MKATPPYRGSNDPLVNAAMEWLFMHEWERHCQVEVQKAIKKQTNAQKAESRAADHLGKLTEGREVKIKLPNGRRVRVWHAEGHAIPELVKRKRKA